MSSHRFSVIKVSDKIDTMKAFANVGFSRLESATENLTEEQLDWKSCPEANTIRWILTHMNNEFFSFFPKIVKADKDYAPKGWPADYVGNKSYSLDKIMGDYRKGKENVLKLLSGLDDEDLKEQLDWFYGKQPMEAYLMLAISEIIHHEGQIAAILGVEKRMKGT
jgi:uncharacterized damage-inducible protein DinB